jgi:hypothetical protein
MDGKNGWITRLMYVIAYSKDRGLISVGLVLE